jgi:plastocyanin
MRPLVAALVALGALVQLPASVGQTIETLRASVGPDFTVSFVRADGSFATTLAPGTYAVAVEDRSPIHDFHLRGPGVSEHTANSFMGTASWTVTLREGYYRYFCSPHEAQMRGALVVGQPPPPALDAVVEDGRIALSRRGETGLLTSLDPGTYAIAVDDRSDQNNFRLTGPGVDEHSQYHIRGPATWTVTFVDGIYHYFSERNPDRLHGSVSVGSPPAPSAGSELRGVTGPDFAITLLNPDSSPVTDLRPGSYTIVVDDTSEEHDFHVSGPGVERTTSLSFVGRTSFRISLSRGLYSFVCDPHTLTMNGGFTVGGGPGAPPARRRLTATVGPGRSITLAPRRVPAGPATIVVRDRSARDNFHLSGPGVDRRTGLRFRGGATWRVELTSGTYVYRSDARASRLRGTLRVQVGTSPSQRTAPGS